jgi:hypothetical protein
MLQETLRAYRAIIETEMMRPRAEKAAFRNDNQ